MAGKSISWVFSTLSGRVILRILRFLTRGRGGHLNRGRRREKAFCFSSDLEQERQMEENLERSCTLYAPKKERRLQLHRQLIKF